VISNQTLKASGFVRSIQLGLQLTVSFLMVAPSIAGQSQKPVKLWSVDLGADPDFQKRLSIEEVLLTPPSLTILGNSQIICGFYDDKLVGFDSSLKKKRFHVLEIDAGTGTLGRKLDFQSSDDRAGVHAVAGDNFVVLAGDQLEKFDSDFSPVGSFPTPVDGTIQHREFWLIDVLWGGEEIALYHRLGGEDRQEVTWLRSNDLSVVKSQPAKFGWGPFTATSDKYAVNPMEDSGCAGCISWFLTDGVVFLDFPTHFAANRRYAIQTLAGKKLISGSLAAEANDLTESMFAERAAFFQWHYVGSGLFYVTHYPSVAGQITVVDWKTNRQIAEIEVEDPTQNPSAGFRESALALSPDGKFLVVLLHHTLTYYRLP
jgi:hypothetical protein